MNFKTLFENCKEQLKEQIKTNWLENKALWKGGITLKDYDKNLDQILDECFTSKNILVEDMGEWEAATSFPTTLLSNNYWREWRGDKEQASLYSQNNTNLVNKGFNPFKHQVESWEKLLKQKKSICVTTGTGSGKTECFMIPVVKDLADEHMRLHTDGQNSDNEPVRAIFLYPLNALMDDQRTRISECIECSGIDLTFAVYNGNTPENIDDKDRNADAVEKDRRKHELVYREEIRMSNHHPNILFTNPTMLEYMLLRESDDAILKDSKGKLRWIVIDETHTFTGAGAAELALLIRRVLDAFDTPIDNVRFATSSATVGGQNGKHDLIEFISDITGKPQNDIEIITGDRVLQKDRNGVSFQRLHNEKFLTLDEMIPTGNNYANKLDKLDKLCDDGLKVKLHLFAKALNRGLYIDMFDTKNTIDQFVLHDHIPIDPNTGSYDEHVLEAVYCNHCGSVFASGKIVDNILKKGELSTTSIFDGFNDNDDDDDNDDNNSPQSQNTNSNTKANSSQSTNEDDFIITFKENAEAIAKSINTSVNQESIRCDLDTNMAFIDGDKYIRYNGCDCPVCGTEKAIRRFNVAADKVARILAPSLLEQAQPYSNPNPQNTILFEGKQMIAFADSRDKAARPTLKQNKENERKWVEWVVYDKLRTSRLSPTMLNNYRQQLLLLQQQLETATDNDRTQLNQMIHFVQNKINTANNPILSWNEALDSLYNDNRCDFFAKQFASKDDLDDNGNCFPEYKRKYVLAALYEVFKYRNKNAQTAETKGQIKIIYPDLETIRQNGLPREITDLNNEILRQNPNQQNCISIDDWIDFLTIYLDHKVRINECLYFRRFGNQDWANIDITACRNLRTVNGVRRTVKKGKRDYNNKYKKILCNLLCTTYEQLNNNQKTLVDDVLDKCWHDLYNNHLIERGQFYNNGWVDDDPDTQYQDDEQGRMNVTRISFVLPDKIWDCPVTNRYLTTTFKEYSPYDDKTLTGLYNKKALPVPIASVQIMREPDLFIQSEHTAQLGKTLTKERTKDFKEHKINVLSCSTTMEMGVDLGSVELVEMTNIPPHPSNYKQRAGRSGRRGQNRSACMTICGSDGIDASFFNNSKANVTKQIEPPTVDLNSPQLIQRHVNSYLFKKWCSTINLMSEVIDLFTDYQWRIDTKTNNKDKTCAQINQNGANVQVSPNGGGKNNAIPYDTTHTFFALWSEFVSYLQRLRLNNPQTKEEKDIRTGLEKKIKDSVYSGGNLEDYVNNTVEAIEKIWKEEIDGYMLTLKGRQQEAENSHPNGIGRYWNGLNYDFTSRLSEPLLNFLSNHQFLPNANMPINIVELKVSEVKGLYSRNNDNPNYDLATALGQWAPGNYITIKDTTYQIGGIQRDYNRSWKTIRKCESCGFTWNTPDNICPSCKGNRLFRWPVNTFTDLKLMEPIAFIPTTDRSRITDNSKNYTMAKAELIGASPINKPTRGLFSHRISDSCNTTSQILIYNDGRGFGYKICKKCGKTELEDGPAIIQSYADVINSFYDKESNQALRYHKDLVGAQNPCFFDINKDVLDDKIYRNFIIGGFIQTDYCEIGLYKFDGLNIIPFADNDRKILTTLGVLICSFMVNEGICERQDIDFIVTSSSTLCIYDKAKGGAGYSKQLNQNMIEKAFGYCRNTLNYCTSIFTLIDTYSQRHADQIDIKSTLAWLEEEYNNRILIPQNITAAYSGATVSSFLAIKQTIK